MPRLTIYHSQEWMTLVETGWMTATVEDTPFGRIAKMVPTPRPWWRA